MGPRNLLILFFSTVAVSLVILIIFFSLFFKNVDLNFNTRLPQSAPVIGGLSEDGEPMDPHSKASGLMRSTVNVPPEFRGQEASTEEKQADVEVSDSEMPPVSDDVMLDSEHEPPVPGRTTPVATSSTDKDKDKKEKKPSATPAPPAEKPLQPLIPPPAPVERTPSGPPVPEEGAAVPSYRVVLGSYANRDEADAAAARATSQGATAIVKQSGNRYSVQLGHFSNRQNAEALAGKTGASVERAN